MSETTMCGSRVHAAACEAKGSVPMLRISGDGTPIVIPNPSDDFCVELAKALLEIAAIRGKAVGLRSAYPSPASGLAEGESAR